MAAPWVAYTGDLIVFDVADAPADLSRYSLGFVPTEGEVKQIAGQTPVATALAFAK